MDKSRAIDWKCYNHMIIADIEPKSEINRVSKKQARLLFHVHKSALCIRYTTHFDAYRESAWWYCIKDSAYDIKKLKAKRRYVINKGISNFAVRMTKLNEHVEEMLSLVNDANKGYEHPPVTLTYEQVRQKCDVISAQSNSFVLGAYESGGRLVGYLWCNIRGKCIYMIEQHCMREYERLECNAALLNMLCEIYSDEYFEKGYYLCDGERTVLHKTEFQPYLTKYFDFRFAYCKLNIIYRPRYYFLIFLLRRCGGLLIRMCVKISPRYVEMLDAVRKIDECSRCDCHE